MEKEVESRESGVGSGEFQIVEGELLEVSTGVEIEPFEDEQTKISIKEESKTKDQKPKTKDQIQYILLPLIFLTVALLGGLRLKMPDNNFLFLKPALICLIFAAFLLVLFVRAGLIKIDGWFSEDFSMLENLANGGVLLALFAATVQIFNALIPETSLPFWIISFCFFWTLAMNVFAEFDTKKLIKSLGALFGIAFLTKYLVLSYLTAPVSESFWRGILENPTQEFFTYLFDLPRFSAGTGYIQFFTVIFYLLGLFLLPPKLSEKD
jgi:intracellular septation protein A